MSVKKEFNQTVNAIEHVLEDHQEDPRKIRESIKLLIQSYQAKEVVSQAYQNFSDSGVVQWKCFLRTANVRTNEQPRQYMDRLRCNLNEMKQFDLSVLKP